MSWYGMLMTLLFYCKTEEDAMNVYNLLEGYLKQRGLTLAPDKTRITNLKDGFDFLGINFRVLWWNSFN